jgi:hypothetical protein
LVLQPFPQVTNNTSKGIKTNNVNNSHDSIVISSRSGGTFVCMTRGLVIPTGNLRFVGKVGDTYLIIKFWNDNRKLKYATGYGDEGSIPVDGNKDFYIAICESKLQFAVEKGHLEVTGIWHPGHEGTS